MKIKFNNDTTLDIEPIGVVFTNGSHGLSWHVVGRNDGDKIEYYDTAEMIEPSLVAVEVNKILSDRMSEMVLSVFEWLHVEPEPEPVVECDFDPNCKCG